MNQYDYIFYPDPNANGEWTVEGTDLEHECVSHKYGPVIVLTPEELKLILQEYAALWESQLQTAAFYLESKGITS